MSRADHRDGDQLRLFLTDDHACTYLPGEISRTMFVDPYAPMNSTTYQLLIDLGFRRSGSDVYRPDCANCSSCISARIPVQHFKPRRSQRRVLKQLESIQVSISPQGFKDEHFELYKKYISSRHPGGEMDNPTQEDYCNFLMTGWCDSILVEFRTEDRLYSVAVVDQLPTGLSAVYTFFDPNMSHLSPGVQAIMWQIQEAGRLGLDWVYLGYWVKGCQKMEYKVDYRPIQLYVQGVWTQFSCSEDITIP